VIESAVLVRACIGLLPVLCFLVALLAMDSYKLVRLPVVAMVIVLGRRGGRTQYLANIELLRVTGMDFASYARTLGPLVEEVCKGLIILVLVRTHRIGFLVDAAIFGFAVGAGFAMIENLYYLQALSDASLGVWIVRGFGTALLHGGVQSIFAVMLLALVDRRGRMDLGAVRADAAGGGRAARRLQPVRAAADLPDPGADGAAAAVDDVRVRAQRGRGRGLARRRFRCRPRPAVLLDSGSFSESPHGQYLHTLRARFPGEVVADLVCYLRLHVELALRAKGLLLMRENGIQMPVDEATRARFEEMRYLEQAVGRTALLAIKPLLHMSRRDLWQLYMLGK
jgi:hypothetical protein